MADKLITPYFRAGYVGLFRPSAPLANPTGKKKYTIKALFPADADLSELKKAAGAVAVEKWGNAVPKTLRSPFRMNEELDNPVAGIPDDWIVMTFAANEDRRPGIVDANNQDIIDESECYSGAWFRAQIRPYAYDQAGNKGVSFGLEHVQKVKDGEPLEGGRIPANKVFEPIGGSTSKSASAMFE